MSAALQELESDKEVLRLLVDFLRKDKLRLLEQASLATRNSTRLSTLYAAVDRLYGGVDRASALEAIEDIVVNVIGAAKYALIEGEECGDATDGALVCVPLRLAGKRTGVIAIYSLKEPKSEFSETDRELFDVLTRHAASALRNCA